MNWSLLMSSHNLAAACQLVWDLAVLKQSLSLDLSQQGDILSIIIQICNGTICFLEPNKELIELKYFWDPAFHSFELLRPSLPGPTKLGHYQPLQMSLLHQMMGRVSGPAGISCCYPADLTSLLIWKMSSDFHLLLKFWI